MDDHSYKDIDVAIRAAHREVAQIEDSYKYEYISIVYQDPKTGEYKITRPKTEQKRRRANTKIRIPKGSARALYHNHPKENSEYDDLQEKFSQGDVALSSKLGIPSFIGAGPKIYKWDPDNPGKMQPKGGAGSTLKEQVGVGSLFHDFDAEETEDLRRLVQTKRKGIRGK